MSLIQNIGVMLQDEATDATAYAASSEDVLETATFSSNGIISSGSIKVNPTVNIEINPSEVYPIPEGYHDGTSQVKLKDLSEVIQVTPEIDGSKILYGKTVWANGSKITGTMEPIIENNFDSFTIDTFNDIVEASFDVEGYRGDGNRAKIAYNYLIDAIPLRAENIRKDVEILGIVGTATQDATATSDTVIKGKQFYSSDGKMTGTLQLESLY